MANIKQWKNYFIFIVATLMILLLGITMINIISPKLKSSYGLNWNEVWKTYVAGVPGTFSVDTVFFDGSDSYELSPQTASVFASTINILQKGVEDSNYDAPSTQHTSISVTGAGFNFNDSGETKYLDNMEDYYDFGGNGALLSYIFFFALMAKYDIFDVTHAREFFEALAENGTGGLLGLLSSTELKEVFYTAENDLTKKETGIYAQINTSPAIVYNNRGYLLTGMYQSINSSNGKEQVDANVMMAYYILTESRVVSLGGQTIYLPISTEIYEGTEDSVSAVQEVEDTIRNNYAQYAALTGSYYLYYRALYNIDYVDCDNNNIGKDGYLAGTSKSLMTVPEGTKIPTGHHLGSGWIDEYTGKQLTNISEANANKDYSLKPNYIPNSYTLTLNANGGEFPNEQKTTQVSRAYGSQYGDLTTPTRTGYTFAGWYTSPTGGSKVSSTTKMGAADTTIYAHWTANTYTVNYTLNGGSYGTYHPTSWTYDVAQQISNPKKTHYDFEGWTASNLSTSTAVYGTTSNPTTKWSNASTKVKASSATGSLYFKNLRTSGTVTLTANWTGTNYTLTYNANGGSVSPGTEQVKYQGEYGELPIPTRQGYIFTGWYTSPTEGSPVSSTDKMTTAGATIYAHWAETWANHISPKLKQDSDGYYKLSTSEDLARVIYLLNSTTRTDVLTMQFKLTNHLDMKDYYWVQAGTEKRPFSGVFDGQGYTIKDLHTITQSMRKDNGGYNAGLFGVTSGAEIKNVYLTDVNISGLNRVGAVVGHVTGTEPTTITAVAVEGEAVTASGSAYGAIVGDADKVGLTDISDCLVHLENYIDIRRGNVTATTIINYKTDTDYNYSGVNPEDHPEAWPNWVIGLKGMKYPMLPKGLAWIASGK